MGKLGRPLDHEEGRLMSARWAHGFNLIELMIVVAIVAILTVLALPNFATQLQNSNTRSAADSLENGIRFAQGEAVRLNRITTFTPSSTGSWTVTYTQITSAGDTGSNILQAQPSTYSSSVSVSTTTPISFNGLGRAGTAGTFTATTGSTGFTPATAEPAVTYPITNSKAPRKLNVRVSPNGKIRMCDPDRTFNATTAPDGC